jgi:voltage-gated potassium channel
MQKSKPRPWRNKLHDIIYESNTKAGKAFDVALATAHSFEHRSGDA